MTKFWSQMSLPARKIRRRIAGCATPVAALVAVSVLAISCGGAKGPPAAQPSSTTPPQSASPGTTPPAQSPTGATPPAQTQTTPTSTPQCATSDLKVWLERELGGGTAGRFYYLLEFKNVSDHSRTASTSAHAPKQASWVRGRSRKGWAHPRAKPAFPATSRWGGSGRMRTAVPTA